MITVPQGIAAIEAGLVVIVILTTWNGPGRLQRPEGVAVDDVSVLPALPALSDPETVDDELSWTA